MTHCKKRKSSRLPYGFTWIELLVVVFAIGILIALLMPAMRTSRGAPHGVFEQFQANRFGNAQLPCFIQSFAAGDGWYGDF